MTLIYYGVIIIQNISKSSMMKEWLHTTSRTWHKAKNSKRLQVYRLQREYKKIMLLEVKYSFASRSHSYVLEAKYSLKHHKNTLWSEYKTGEQRFLNWISFSRLYKLENRYRWDRTKILKFNVENKTEMNDKVC